MVLQGGSLGSPGFLDSTSSTNGSMVLKGGSLGSLNLISWLSWFS